MGIYKAKQGKDDKGKPVYGAPFAVADDDFVKAKVEAGEFVAVKGAGPAPATDDKAAGADKTGA